MKLSLPSSRNNILKEERRKTEREEEKVGCGEGSFYVEWQRECPCILQVVPGVFLSSHIWWHP